MRMLRRIVYFMAVALCLTHVTPNSPISSHHRLGTSGQARAVRAAPRRHSASHVGRDSNRGSVAGGRSRRGMGQEESSEEDAAEARAKKLKLCVSLCTCCCCMHLCKHESSTYGLSVQSYPHSHSRFELLAHLLRHLHGCQPTDDCERMCSDEYVARMRAVRMGRDPSPPCTTRPHGQQQSWAGSRFERAQRSPGGGCWTQGPAETGGARTPWHGDGEQDSVKGINARECSPPRQPRRRKENFEVVYIELFVLSAVNPTLHIYV